MTDPIFETDGMVDCYLWMWYCPECHSTLPPFMFEKEGESCPCCGIGKLQKAKVEQPL